MVECNKLRKFKKGQRMTEEVTSSSGVNHSGDTDNKICQICSDVSTGFYYSVWSCEGCKAFFKRCLQAKDGANYVCPATNSCTIDKTRRKCCQACRLRKCYEVGMQKTGSRRERSTKGKQKNLLTDDSKTPTKRRRKNTNEPDELNIPSSKLPSPTCSAHIQSLTNLSGSPASIPAASPASDMTSPESLQNEAASPTSSLTPDVQPTSTVQNLATDLRNTSVQSSNTSPQMPLGPLVKDIKVEVCDVSCKQEEQHEVKVSSQRTKHSPESYEMPIHPIVKGLLDCEPPIRYTNHVPLEVETEESLMTSFVKLADTELVDVITWAKNVPGYSSLALSDRIHLVDSCWMEILVCGLSWRSKDAEEGHLCFAPDLICNRDAYYTAGIGPIGDRMVAVAKQFREMSLTKEEFVCFRALTLLNADLSCLEDPDALFKARQGIIDALLYTVQNRTRGSENRVTNILLLQPHVRQCGVNATAHMFEMQHEEAFPISDLVKEMLQIQDTYTTK